jgi:signal transduction histidine kinase
MVAERSARGRRLRAWAGAVRVRATVGAVAVVGIAVLVGSFVFVNVLRNILTDGVKDAAQLRAAELVAALDAGQTPTLAGAEEDEQLIQIIGESGAVIAASPNVKGRPAVADIKPGRSTRIEARIGDETLDFVAVAAATTSSTAAPRTVIVARFLEDVNESVQIVTRLLLWGLPLLLLVVAFTTWQVIGRALAPVDAIRREVEEISAAELHRRVPDPPGRDEVSRLATTMNRMLGRLERAQQRQQRFVSDASHELRSPVASIRQHAEVAIAHPDRTTTVELAETVLAEDLRVQRLVEDLLLLARADEHTLPRNVRAIDLDDVVLDEAQRLRDITELDVDTSAVSAGRVMGDAAQLRRMLRNLVDNAARHARSRIALSLNESNGFVVLRVDDDGTGIPSDDRSRIFERFVRLDEARTRDGGGAGLGLAIVHEVTTAHGGTVTAGESSNGGARLEVRLPASNADRPQGGRRF